MESFNDIFTSLLLAAAAGLSAILFLRGLYVSFRRSSASFSKHIGDRLLFKSALIFLFSAIAFTGALSRDDYRRSLITAITNSCSGTDVSPVQDTLEYSYDALSRPVSRTGGMGVSPVQDAFGYNDRSEVVLVSKSVGLDDPIAPPGGSQSPATVEYAYHYDSIGNSIIASFNGTTCIYSANNLNQYSSISISASDFGLQVSRLNLTMMCCYGVRPRSKVEKQ